MIHPHPNWLQRRYFTWAQPHYDRMEPALRAEAQRIDLWLYSGQGLIAWLVLCLAIAASTALLWALGLPWVAAMVVATMLWVGPLLLCLAAWLKPQEFTWRRGARTLLWATVAALLGVAVGTWLRHRPDAWALPAPDVLARGLLVAAAVVLPLLTLSWGVAALRRHRLALALHTAQQAQALAEARLHALQAQIQPHFLFNTLAAVQHWVDSGDARAGGLLRDLTAFLRGATALFTRPMVTLADELAWVRHYLAVQQARLGGRLRIQIDMAADSAAFELPPGLVLTLVENAIEHGLAPQVAGGTLTLRAWREAGALHLTVADDGAGLPEGWVEGTGLANTRARLAAAFGSRATFMLVPGATGGAVAHVAIGNLS
ncbi:MAG: histidine kinase [Proteobacteria bacterium]|nr:histidine kinase [Pseudomonadota bacterium]